MTQRQPRLIDVGYLKWLRTCMCSYCRGFSPCDAAHIRSGSIIHDKPPTGMGQKPDDKWAVSLCRSCHMKQHSMNEIEFWTKKGLCPFSLAKRLYKIYGGKGGHPKVKRTTIKPRLPKEKRAKIQSRSFGPQKRKFGQ